MADRVIDKIYLKNSSGTDTEYQLGADSVNVAYGDGVSVKTKIERVESSVSDHTGQGIDNESGIHGFRYYQKQLQAYNTTTQDWETVTITTETDIPIGDVVGARLTANSTSITLYWSDPENIDADNVWAGTVVVRKVGAAPADPTDGTVILTNEVRNQYSSTGYTDSTVDQDKIYYYRFFPYKIKEGVRKYTNGTALSGSVVFGLIENTPVPTPDHYSYDGTTKTPSWNYYDANKMTREGELTGSEAKVYVVNFTPKFGYRWADNNGSETRTVNLSIGVQPLVIPSLLTSSFTYPDYLIRSDITGFDNTTMELAGDTGEEYYSLDITTYTPTDYTLIIKIRDKANYAWSDGTNTDKQFIWRVNSRSILEVANIPSTIYSGASQTPSLPILSSTVIVRGISKMILNNNYYNVSGDNPQTNAGDYPITFSLKSRTQGYILLNNSTEDQVKVLTIEKADNPTSVSSTEVTLDENHTSVQVTLSDVIGTVTVLSNNNSIATVVKNEDILTISSPSEAKGSAIIIVNVNGEDNYKNKQILINVIANFLVVPWSTSSDTEIKEMIDAYYNGTLSLQDITSVLAIGDIRQANNTDKAKFKVASNVAPRVYDGSSLQTNYTISEMTTVKLVIIDFNHSVLKEAIGSISNALVTIQMLGMISDSASPSINSLGISMNNSDTNTGGLSGSILYTYLNDNFYNACGFKNLIKIVKNPTKLDSSSDNITQCEDKVFLLSEIEIFNTKTKSRGGEGTQYKYFEISSNRIKNKSLEGTGTAYHWWERSVSKNDSINFCFVISSNGSAGMGPASRNFGVAPACAF